MRNKYGGNCYICGLHVVPGTGHFERVKGEGWRVKHALHTGHGRVTCEMAIAEDKKHAEAECDHLDPELAE